MRTYNLFLSDEIKPPRIFMLGCARHPKETSHPKAKRGIYIIHYVVSGKGYFNEKPVDTGEGFIITPDTIDNYDPDDNDPWTYLWFNSDDEHIEPFLREYKADPETRIFKYRNVGLVRKMAEQMFDQKIIAASISLSELMEKFFYVFNNCILTEAADAKSGSSIFYEHAVNYIDTNLHLPISVSGLCRILGITQPYLYRIFKNEVGISPKQYITNKKLARAKKFLAETDLSISEIAKSVGIGDVLTFSKFFSTIEKMSPTRYRDENKKKS